MEVNTPHLMKVDEAKGKWVILQEVTPRWKKRLEPEHEPGVPVGKLYAFHLTRITRHMIKVMDRGGNHLSFDKSRHDYRVYETEPVMDGWESSWRRHGGEELEEAEAALGAAMDALRAAKAGAARAAARRALEEIE